MQIWSHNPDACREVFPNATDYAKSDEIGKSKRKTRTFFDRLNAKFPTAKNESSTSPLISLDNRKTSVEAINHPNFAQRRRFKDTKENRLLWGRAVIEAATSLGSIERYVSCGADAVVLHSDSADKYKINAQTCGSRHCPICGIRRRMETTNRLMSKLPVFKIHEWKFITLTLRSVKGDLKPQLDHLMESFRRLRQKVAWKENVQYGWGVIEVTWNEKRNTWHPHIHCIAKAGYWNHHHLSDEWESASRGSPIVDIREIQTAKTRVQYIAKYIGKGPDLRLARNPRAVAVDYVRALKGRRMLVGFGSPPTLPPPPDDSEGSTSVEDWKIVGQVGKLLKEARNGRVESIKVLQRIYPGLTERDIRSDPAHHPP